MLLANAKASLAGRSLSRKNMWEMSSVQRRSTHHPQILAGTAGPLLIPEKRHSSQHPSRTKPHLSVYLFLGRFPLCPSLGRVPRTHGQPQLNSRSLFASRRVEWDRDTMTRNWLKVSVLLPALSLDLPNCKWNQSYLLLRALQDLRENV